MAGSVNKVIIVGRLGAEPETKAVGDSSVTRLNVATSESWKDKNGQKQERTEWHRVVVWGKQGENAAKYLAKGRQVYIEGRIQTRSWEDDQGVKKYSTEIVATTVTFLGGGEGGGSGGGQGGGNRSNKAEAQDSFEDFGPEPSFDDSDEMPF